MDFDEAIATAEDAEEVDDQGFNIAIAEAFKLATTFKQWERICNLAPSNSEFANGAMAKMLELATTFENWDSVCAAANFRFEHKTIRLAITRMSELANDFDQWLIVYGHVNDEQDDPICQEAIRRLESLADSRHKWKLIFGVAPPQSEVEKKARRLMKTFRKKRVSK